MDRPSCGAPVKRGGSCRAFALPNGRCWSHDPSRAAEHRAAYAKGARLKAINGRRAKLDTAAGLIRFVSGVVQDCLEVKLSPDVARAVLYGCSIQRQLIETGDLARRLETLEASLAAADARGARRWRA